MYVINAIVKLNRATMTLVTLVVHYLVQEADK